MKRNKLFYVIILVVVITYSCSNDAGYERNKASSDNTEESVSSAQSNKHGKKELNSNLVEAQPTLVKDIQVNFNTPEDRKFLKTFKTKFKVKNVKSATEQIEDLTRKFGGFVTFSELKNEINSVSRTDLSRDSILKLTEYIVVNDIKLRVPNARIDSFIRELNPIINFLDNRVINLQDVTIQFRANNKKAERLETYNNRQIKHIDSKDSKLKETTSAEDNLLEHQLQSDNLLYDNLELEDRIKYCDITMFIYQNPVIKKETIVNSDNLSSFKPNFFIRVWDSIVVGFTILEEIIIVLIKIWGILLIGFILYKLIKYIVKLLSKK